MGEVLKQAAGAASSGAETIWGLHAEYHAALGFHASAREALLKQARCGREEVACLSTTQLLLGAS